MARWDRNGEGYADRTAGIVLQNIPRDGREAVMAKKRSCRRTADEDIIHDKAVKLRKMTDRQLVQYIEHREDDAWKKGFSRGQDGTGKIDPDGLIEEIRNVRGIGAVKMKAIAQIIRERLGA